VYVEDVNEFSPVWNEQQYSAVVDEISEHKDIIQVAATDTDGSAAMSKICQYHVITPGVPFEVDELGNDATFWRLCAGKTQFFNIELFFSHSSKIALKSK